MGNCIMFLIIKGKANQFIKGKNQRFFKLCSKIKVSSKNFMNATESHNRKNGPCNASISNVIGDFIWKFLLQFIDKSQGHGINTIQQR